MDILINRYQAASALIRAFLQNNETVLLASPEKPDPDSYSCQFAFREYLEHEARALGSTSRFLLYAPDAPTENTLYKFLEPLGNLSSVNTRLPDESVGLCILFDYGSALRTHTAPLITNETFFLGFDHHPKQEEFPKLGYEIIDEHAPSTTALLYRFLKHGLEYELRHEHKKFPISADVATCLFAGLAADTKNFTNSLTNAEAHEIAGELIRLGARHHEIAAAMQPTMTLARLRAHRYLLPLAHIDEEIGFCFFSFTQSDLAECRAKEKDFLSFRKTLESVQEITVAVVYYELPEGEWYGSIRTKPDAPIFAEAIAQHFGGGGHEHEAGFTSAKTAGKIKTEITELIKKTKAA